MLREFQFSHVTGRVTFDLKDAPNLDPERKSQATAINPKTTDPEQLMRQVIDTTFDPIDA